MMRYSVTSLWVAGGGLNVPIKGRLNECGNAAFLFSGKQWQVQKIGKIKKAKYTHEYPTKVPNT